MAAEKTVSIDELFTPDELAQALAIWRRLETPAHEICEKVVKPNMARVNTKLDQENNPLYIAYMIEYVFNETERRPPR
jgi:hypothetical protein